MLPVVGAPHAFPGLLLKAPDHIRNSVSLAIVVATPVVLVYCVWHGVIWRTLFPREETTVERRVETPESLLERFRQKSSDELQAILATKGRSRYPITTYQLAERVLKERADPRSS